MWKRLLRLCNTSVVDVVFIEENINLFKLFPIFQRKKDFEPTLVHSRSVRCQHNFDIESDWFSTKFVLYPMPYLFTFLNLNFKKFIVQIKFAFQWLLFNFFLWRELFISLCKWNLYSSKNVFHELVFIIHRMQCSTKAQLFQRLSVLKLWYFSINPCY